MKLFARLAITALVALSGPVIAAEAARAQASKAVSRFECQRVDGYYATVAIDSSGRSAPMIAWASQEFSGSGYTPQRRCNEVTNRLNSVLRDNGNSLRNIYLTVGPVNRHVVLCHVGDTRSGCNSTNVLFTLSQRNQRSSNPRELLENLFNARALGTGNPVQQSGGQAYVNLETLVNGLF